MVKTKNSYILPLFVGIALFAVGLFLYTPTVSAATFTVDSVADDGDSTPGNGSCDDGSGDCTLRAAIEETNALPGADTIEFNIAGAGVHTITPASEMEIQDEVTINGETQTGASCNTLVPTNLPAEAGNQPHELLIQIDPNGATSGFILRDNGDNSTIRGLIIGDAIDGFTLDSASSVTIECNYIGTNAAGTALVSNSATNILVNADSYDALIQNNLISGSSSAAIDVYTGATIQHNLIGTDVTGMVVLGNSSAGVQTNAGPLIYHNIIAGSNGGSGVSGSSATGVAILGNYIGVGLDGSVLGNTGDGIQLFSTSSYEIGGVDADERNIISANEGDGVEIYNDCNGGDYAVGGSIVNNYIGTNANGEVTDGYGNGGSGVEVQESSGFCASVYRHQIGGVETGQANVIAGNTMEGVLIHQGEFNDVFSISVLQNSIFRNGAFGIDLAANSNGDANQDLGPNGLNNFPITYPATRANYYLDAPIVNSVTPSGSDLTVNYDFTAPDITNNAPQLLAEDLVGYRLEFFLNDSETDGDYAGYTQGQTFLGSFVIDGSENDAAHTFTTAEGLELDGKYVTATATVLWQNRGDTDPCVTDERYGVGPPYIGSTGCVM